MNSPGMIVEYRNVITGEMTRDWRRAVDWRHWAGHEVETREVDPDGPADPYAWVPFLNGGLCVGGGIHEWRPEWRAVRPGGYEWRTQCGICGLRRARVEAAPDPMLGDPRGIHYLPATDAWPDAPDE